MGGAIRAIWSKLWGRGVTISIEESWPDASRDKCLKCGVERGIHPEKKICGHNFVEQENLSK